MKRIILIAGPNGAGKTTFAREYLPREANCPNLYRPLVDRWELYDNSGAAPILLAQGNKQ